MTGSTIVSTTKAKVISIAGATSFIATALAIGAYAICVGAAEPPAGFSTKTLLRTTLSGDAGKEAIIATAELAPGASTGRHTHPGDEYATVLQGMVEIRVDGQEPKRVGAGDAYHNAKGVLHETRSVGTVPAKLVSTFIIDKGQPITQPAR
jgi:quercetin dioxygenase-like cupin family protein